MIDKRVQYMIEKLFAIRKTNFAEFPAKIPELDLVEAEEQITHELTLDETYDTEEGLSTFPVPVAFVVSLAITMSVALNVVAAMTVTVAVTVTTTTTVVVVVTVTAVISVAEAARASGYVSAQTDAHCADIFRPDPNFLENEAKWEEAKKEILGEEEPGEAGDEEGEGAAGTGAEGGEGGFGEVVKAPQTTVIQDQTETDKYNLRSTIYLTIMSSVDFEEAAHKLLKIKYKPGQEVCTQRLIYRERETYFFFFPFNLSVCMY